MNTSTVPMDVLRIAVYRSRGVQLEARIQGEDLAYALSTEQARDFAGALRHLAPGNLDDYFSTTDTITLVCNPLEGLYIETYFGVARVLLPLDQQGAKRIAADLLRCADVCDNHLLRQ